MTGMTGMTGDERDRERDRERALALDQDIEAKLRLVITVLMDTVSDIAKLKAAEAVEAAKAVEAAEAVETVETAKAAKAVEAESLEAVETESNEAAEAVEAVETEAVEAESSDEPPKKQNHKTSKASKASKASKKKPNTRRVEDAEGAVEEARKHNAHLSRLHRELAEQTETARREKCLREKVERRIESIIEEMRDMRATHKYDLAALDAALVEANARREDGIHDIVRGPEKEGGGGAKESGGAKERGSSLVSLIYDESVRTTSSIAALDGGSMGEDDARAMRVFCDVQCTASVLDPHGMLCGLMHVTCPVTAMRAWVVSRHMVDIIAVREIRADPTSEKARGAFTAAMLRRASSTTLGAMVIDRGPGKHGNVRVVTKAARRCRLEAQPDEMLAWLVRARARSVLDLCL